MQETPLYDALRRHASLRPAAFHMPGHKGHWPYPDWPDPATLDVTELPDTGNLYVGRDCISQAEALWERAWGFAHCQFLTGGSTQGVLAALLLCAREGKGILADRGSHRSVYNAMALYDLRPTWFRRSMEEPADPEKLDEALARAMPEDDGLTTVCITSPTYYGVLSDIPAIAQVCHRRGVTLAVDAAHGCHLPFLRDANPFRGADLVISSAHKTLPVYGQGAVLFSDGNKFSHRDLRWAASVVGTSSPSYPVMASLDRARAYMESPRTLAEFRNTASDVREFRAGFAGLTDCVDPWRLTLRIDPSVSDGFRVKASLEAMGIFPEMADRDHVVFLLSPQNTRGDLDRLWNELKLIEKDWPGVWGGALECPVPPEPEAVLTPRETLTAPRRLVELAEAEGEISAVQVAPYPPGVPVIAPGERITKKTLAYLREVGYNVHQGVEVAVHGR